MIETLLISTSQQTYDALSGMGINILRFPEELRVKRPKARAYLLALDVNEPGYLSRLVEFSARPIEPLGVVLIGDANLAQVARDAMRERIVATYIARDELANTELLLRELNRAADSAVASYAAVQDYARIHTLAYTDPLTKVENRTAWIEYLQSMIDPHSEAEIGLGLFDMRGFKAINDQFGQQTGDIALQVFAKTLKDSLRRSDHVYRHGGDEFAIVFSLPTSVRRDAAIHAIEQKLHGNLNTVAIPNTDATVGARFVITTAIIRSQSDIDTVYAELSEKLTQAKAREKQ
jgi:diguanylate cyclase (GGDEF)-like protein